MSRLTLLQSEFTALLSRLILHIEEGGFTCTLGEGYRTTEQAEINSLPLIDRKVIAGLLEEKYPAFAKAIGESTSHGIRNSNHRNRLAQDLNLYKDDIWLTDAGSYKVFGEWWKQQHPLARWGGDFEDADHFSLEFNGVE